MMLEKLLRTKQLDNINNLQLYRSELVRIQWMSFEQLTTQKHSTPHLVYWLYVTANNLGFQFPVKKSRLCFYMFEQSEKRSSARWPQNIWMSFCL